RSCLRRSAVGAAARRHAESPASNAPAPQDAASCKRSFRSIDTNSICAFAGKVNEKRACPTGRPFCDVSDLLVQTELLVELGHASAGIHQLLLAREEGVTLRADFHLDILLGRTCLNHITAGASNRSLLIIGMDSFLHCSRSPLSDPD